MAELEADVRAAELVHWNRQLQQLGPAGAVVVIKHEGAVLAGGRLSGAEGDKILAEETRGLTTASFTSYFESEIALSSRPAPQIAQHVE